MNPVDTKWIDWFLSNLAGNSKLASKNLFYYVTQIRMGYIGQIICNNFSVWDRKFKLAQKLYIYEQKLIN